MLRFVAGFSSTAGLLLASGLVLNWLIRQGTGRSWGCTFVGLGLGIAVSGVAVAALVQACRDCQWLGLGLLGIVFLGPHGFGCRPSARAACSRSGCIHTTPPRRWMGCSSPPTLRRLWLCHGRHTRSPSWSLPLLADKGGWVGDCGLAAAPSCSCGDRGGCGGQIRALMMALVCRWFSVLMPIATDHALLNVAAPCCWGHLLASSVSRSP